MGPNRLSGAVVFETSRGPLCLTGSVSGGKHTISGAVTKRFKAAMRAVVLDVVDGCLSGGKGEEGKQADSLLSKAILHL